MDTNTSASTTRRKPFRGVAFAAAICVAGAGLALTAPLTATAAGTAHAASDIAPFASHGPGFDSADGFLGAYMVGGVATICLQITAAPPLGDTEFVGNQAWASMSADDNARVNWATSKLQERLTNTWAAATALYGWSLADSAEYNSNGMSGDTYYVARVPSSLRADVLDKLAQLRAEGAGITAGQQGGGGVGLSLDVDSTNNYVGTLTVVDMTPADAAGTITLTNGVFTDTGSSTISGVTNGMVLNVRGNPEDGAIDYKISGSGSFSKSSGYAGQVGLYQSAGGAQQYTAGPGPKAEVSFSADIEDPMTRSTVFQPIVTSQMQQTWVGPGGTITDHATCDIAPDSVTPEWRTNRDGTGVPVKWDVSFYEKHDDENNLPEVPEGREVLGTGTATCDGVGDVMEVSIVKPEGFTGVMTAVWAMTTEGQDDSLQGDWHDFFGLAAETTVAPRVTTKAVPSVYDGEEYGDTAVHTDVALYPETAVETFTAYRIVDGQNVCDATTVFKEESAPILVDGRTEVPGPTFIAGPEMGEGVNWIERTYTDDTKTTLISEGECGEPGEQTLRKVHPTPSTAGLASTGFDGSATGWIAGSLVALGVALMTGLAVRRRTVKTDPIAEGSTEK